jgi:hypothetical protein
MSLEDVPYEDSFDGIRAWVQQSTYPRPASSAAVGEAFATVLSRLADAHLDRFVASSPAVISLPSMCVAIVLWGDDPTAPMPTWRAPLVLFNTLLWSDQGALEYAVALTVAGIIAGRLGNAGTPQEQQDQVHHLLRSWGYSVPASIEGRGCRLTIEIVSEAPGTLVIGLQPSGDDDVEAFSAEWPSIPRATP